MGPIERERLARATAQLVGLPIALKATGVRAGRHPYGHLHPTRSTKEYRAIMKKDF